MELQYSPNLLNYKNTTLRLNIKLNKMNFIASDSECEYIDQMKHKINKENPKIKLLQEINKNDIYNKSLHSKNCSNIELEKNIFFRREE